MAMDDRTLNRRTMLKLMGAGVTAAAFYPFGASAADEDDIIKKEIPSSGQKIPVIGMGTWQTFNVGGDKKLRDARTEVLKAFFEAGGTVIDSSPMYGSSQDVVGYGLKKLGATDRVFAADKIWTSDGGATRSQYEESADKWNIEKFELMQVHNLRAWREHLDTLEEMKEAGEVRYIGITTSHTRRHDEFEEVMKSRDLDFVQLTYNLARRVVEKRLLPLAQERDIAVLVNRPFGGGGLIDQVKGKEPLPDWADDIGCDNWAQFLLKFIVSHPAVTCAIPATTRVEHMRENMGALRGELPDKKIRERMIAHFQSL
ncbi:MAG: aldo/keto reductase [Persicimonas sp.]